MELEAGTRRDVAVIKAVREAIGPKATLMIDANNAWNVNLTKRVLTETRDCNVFWVEEPFHEDPMTSKVLRDWISEQGPGLAQCLVADGEGCAAPPLLEWARDGAIDVVQYSSREKGLTFWLDLDERLRSWGLMSAPHNFGSSLSNYATAHLAAVIGCFVEWDYADTKGLQGVERYVIKEGRVSIPQVSGFGWTLDNDIFVPEHVINE